MIMQRCKLCGGLIEMVHEEVGWIHIDESGEKDCTGIFQGAELRRGGFYLNPLVMSNGELFILE
tara:strand:+ start:85 stop:276 length:192 start_codon:yes stop_codon:yes gene_type:complete